jgi:hypothetical protein
LENNAKCGEGIVQGVVKATQTGILWSQIQVLVGPPEIKVPTFGLVFFCSKNEDLLSDSPDV